MRCGAFIAALIACIIRSSASNNTVVFIEQVYYSQGDPTLGRIASVTAVHGGVGFTVLSMMTWEGSYSPNETVALPPPDASSVAFLKAAREGAPAPLKVWGGVSLCPGREYACMLNYTQSNITGTQLGAAILAAGLDGVIIYVSPYCNNADCKRTTGKYAEGIAAILAAFRAAAPGLDIALPLNEWDNGQIVVKGDPTAVFSWQTVFYFTTITDCVDQCGALCGAGESIAYITRAGKNFTDVLSYLSSHNVRFLGQFSGASANASEVPGDYWSALATYAAA